MSCEIKPVRVVLLFIAVAMLASVVPARPQAVSLMTPLYRTLSGVYGYQ
jgi:hypothetical protein